MTMVLLGYASANPTYNFNLDNALVERGVSLDTDLPTLREEQSSTSPGLFSQFWEKRSEWLEVPLPMLGEGFRVRANG